VNLAQHLGALERQAEALGRHWCPSCGGPSRHGHGLVVIPSVDHECPVCPSCSLKLGEDGRPIGCLNDEGDVIVKLLILDPDPLEAPPYPST
jgi:hypothetical protein